MSEIPLTPEVVQLSAVLNTMTDEQFDDFLAAMYGTQDDEEEVNR